MIAKNSETSRSVEKGRSLTGWRSWECLLEEERFDLNDELEKNKKVFMGMAKLSQLVEGFLGRLIYLELEPLIKLELWI